VPKLPQAIPDVAGRLTDGPQGARPSSWVGVTLGLLLASAAAIWHGYLMTSATNDNFLHMALAKQWLGGDWPVRDFFDQGWVLQYGLSAAAQSIGGDRLMPEAVIVGLAWAISTFVVFVLVRRLTQSLVAALAAAPSQATRAALQHAAVGDADDEVRRFALAGLGP